MLLHPFTLIWCSRCFQITSFVWPSVRLAILCIPSFWPIAGAQQTKNGFHLWTASFALCSHLSATAYFWRWKMDDLSIFFWTRLSGHYSPLACWLLANPCNYFTLVQLITWFKHSCLHVDLKRSTAAFAHLHKIPRLCGNRVPRLLLNPFAGVFVADF